MFENQEEFIFELYDKNGNILTAVAFYHTSEDGRYLPVYPLPEKDNLNILGNLTKTSEVYQWLRPTRIYFFRPGSYSPRLIGYPGRGKEITNKDIS